MRKNKTISYPCGAKEKAEISIFFLCGRSRADERKDEVVYKNIDILEKKPL